MCIPPQKDQLIALKNISPPFQISVFGQMSINTEKYLITNETDQWICLKRKIEYIMLKKNENVFRVTSKKDK